MRSSVRWPVPCLVLAYAKIAVLVLPLLAAFALWVWIARAQFTPPSRQNLLLCLGIFFVLACLPNLPALRETSFVAKFDFGPFEAWQRGYSAESIIFVDRPGSFPDEKTLVRAK